MTDSIAIAAGLHERDARVTVAGVEIACRTTLPRGVPRGAILLVPGSLYSDVDGNYPTMNLRPHAYADLAHQFGERGFATLRMAKIGPGTGSRTIDPAAARHHLDFLTRVAVASAGLDLLRSMVTARPVIVAGHSEGAVVAFLLAATPGGSGIDGLVSLSGPALPILSIMRRQVAAMAPPDATPDMTMFDRTVAAIRAGGAPPDEARAHPSTAMLASMPDEAIAYLRSADRIDPVAAVAKVRVAVLIVQGGRDDSVPASHARLLADARAGLPTETAAFPALTHFYKHASANLTPMEKMAIETDCDPAVAEAICAWATRLEPRS